MQGFAWSCLALTLLSACGCGREPAAARPALVAASSTMTTAWNLPRDPRRDASLDGSPMAAQVRWGFQIFVDTPKEAPRYAPGGVSCANCHLNAGQRERALPLVGIAGMFPEPNARAGRLISLPDRIVDCFNRSENAAGPAGADLPSTASKEVLALAAYVTWLSNGYAVGQNPSWRNRNTIPAAQLIPLSRLDTRAGEAIFAAQCTSCHGVDGQGVQIGDKKAGPLWGARSWNDGAGAARVYTLAGIIRYSMPYLDPGSLSDEAAQQVAAFITSKPRPVYPFKERDYPSGKIPPDAVYYPKK